MSRRTRRECRQIPYPQADAKEGRKEGTLRTPVPRGRCCSPATSSSGMRRGGRWATPPTAARTSTRWSPPRHASAPAITTAGMSSGRRPHSAPRPRHAASWPPATRSAPATGCCAPHHVEMSEPLRGEVHQRAQVLRTGDVDSPVSGQAAAGHDGACGCGQSPFARDPRAPRAARSQAVAAPMPRPAPVIATTFPAASGVWAGNTVPPSRPLAAMRTGFRMAR
jgi:hypothetical protein